MWSEFIAGFLFFVFLIIGNFKGIRYEINDFSSLECVVMQISKVPEYFFTYRIELLTEQMCSCLMQLGTFPRMLI